jgi:predicted deacylase
MQKQIETLAGDIEGVSYAFPVYRFDGSDPAAQSAYLQAALHGDELPGVVAIDALMPKLLAAEREGRLRGRMTVVPMANPIGRSQYLFGDRQGRFHLGTRTNFNRDFPLLATPDAVPPDSREPTQPADQRLKSRLIELSMGHDIVLDLHCDDEGVPYFYVPKALWPGMADCAAAMGMQAVILWDGDCGAAFDQASIDPYLNATPEIARLDRRVVATVELRGEADVYPDLAASDAEGLYRLLVARGVIEDGALPQTGHFSGLAAHDRTCRDGHLALLGRDPLSCPAGPARRGRRETGDHRARAWRAGRLGGGASAAGRFHPDTPQPAFHPGRRRPC